MRIPDGRSKLRNRRLALEKPQRELLDLAPRLRQMHGPGIAQLYIVAFANMAGGAEADRGHSRRDGGLDSAGAVLDHKAAIRADAQLPGGKQEDVGMGFSARDHVGAENMIAEFRFHAQHREAELQPIDRAG